MPLNAYGVLCATPTGRRLATVRSDHYMLLCGAWQVAINARSQLPPSDVAYAVVTPFEHPLLERVHAFADGWHPLPVRTAQAGGLDYLRAGIVARESFKPLPLGLDGPGNDLNDLLDLHLRPLFTDRRARVYAFGERYDVGKGVHDIHQNQGNSGRFKDADGVWQDGGVLAHLAGVWTLIALRFQSQAWRTDDMTGHTLRGGTGTNPLVRRT